VLIDLPYLEDATWFLRSTVERLETHVSPSLLARWFREASGGDWEHDADQYRRLKLLTTFVQSRPHDLPEINESVYLADKQDFAA
jgi:hypothetical protein